MGWGVLFAMPDFEVEEVLALAVLRNLGRLYRLPPEDFGIDRAEG
jgi:hypothetical protein